MMSHPLPSRTSQLCQTCDNGPLIEVGSPDIASGASLPHSLGCDAILAFSAAREVVWQQRTLASDCQQLTFCSN